MLEKYEAEKGLRNDPAITAYKRKCYDETAAAGDDILAGRQQNHLMPWRNTIRFQEHMERIRNKF
mgnify:CR=1 FL=1